MNNNVCDFIACISFTIFNFSFPDNFRCCRRQQEWTYITRQLLHIELLFFHSGPDDPISLYYGNLLDDSSIMTELEQPAEQFQQQ